MHQQQEVEIRRIKAQYVSALDQAFQTKSAETD